MVSVIDLGTYHAAREAKLEFIFMTELSMSVKVMMKLMARYKKTRMACAREGRPGAVRRRTFRGFLSLHLSFFITKPLLTFPSLLLDPAA